MKNSELSAIFRNIAELLAVKGDNPFRVRAYERAAQNIEGLTEDIESYVREQRLTDIPGIGKDLAEKITEFVKTGKIGSYEELKKTIPAGLLELLKIPTIGPKTAMLLHEKLKIKDIPGLESALRGGKLQGIFGIKDKTIENIIKGIEIYKRGKDRMTLAQAVAIADEFVQYLKKSEAVKTLSPAGSLRRRKETVRDIDILVISDDPHTVMQHFVKMPLVKDIIAEGPTKSSVRTIDDVQVDCRVVEKDSFGAALVYFTGSKNFNIKLRSLAIKLGCKINEYGVFKKESFVAGKSEEEVFKLLGMSYIEPELREDTGEIESAQRSGLPRLIDQKDIKGDLHVHSDWSDGNNSIAEMADAARALGYEYVALTDHSQSLKVANGLSIADLKKKKDEIEGLNKKLKNFTVLYGTEADIDTNGDIDYPDKVLKEFDVVIAAVHSGFKQSKETLTKRIIKACQNKYVNIIAHPTGKLWGERAGYDIDTDEILKVARETNTQMEINAYPQRLDLDSIHSRRAKEMGARLAINTDSHAPEQFLNMQFGVAVARRGWLEKKDVVNTLSVEKLLKTLKK